MSIRKISALVSAFIVSLCLTGCGPDAAEKVHETPAHWGTNTHAKNRISVEKTMPQDIREPQEQDTIESDELESELEKQKLD